MEFHMKPFFGTALITFALVGAAFAQNPPARGGGGAPGRGGQPPVQVQGPFSVRNAPPWGAVRTGAQSVIGWNIGVDLSSYPRLMFSEAAAKADALGVAFVKGSGKQKVSPSIQKAMGAGLFPGEQKEVQTRLNSL